MRKRVLSICISTICILFLVGFFIAKKKACTRLDKISEITELDSWSWLPCTTLSVVNNGTTNVTGKYGPIFTFEFIAKGVSRDYFCIGAPVITIYVVMFGPVVAINTPFSSDFDTDKEEILKKFIDLQQPVRGGGRGGVDPLSTIKEARSNPTVER